MCKIWKHWLHVYAKTRVCFAIENHPRISCRAYLAGTRSKRIRRSSSSSRVWYNSCKMTCNSIIFFKKKNHQKYIFRNLLQVIFSKKKQLQSIGRRKNIEKTLKQVCICVCGWYISEIGSGRGVLFFVSSWSELYRWKKTSSQMLHCTRICTQPAHAHAHTHMHTHTCTQIHAHAHAHADAPFAIRHVH